MTTITDDYYYYYNFIIYRMKNMNKTWENTKHFFRMIKYIFGVAFKTLKDRRTWLVIAFIVWSYLVAFFNANYYTQSPVKEWQRIIVPRQSVKPIKNARVVTVHALETKKPIHVPTLTKLTIEKHKKYLTQQQYENQQFALKYFEAFYDKNETQAMDNVILSEGWYQTDNRNPESGACGIGQAYPCEKMKCPLDQSGLECQLEWTMNYVDVRYGNPIKAWEFRKTNGWY